MKVLKCYTHKLCEMYQEVRSYITCIGNWQNGNVVTVQLVLNGMVVVGEKGCLVDNLIIILNKPCNSNSKPTMGKMYIFTSVMQITGLEKYLLSIQPSPIQPSLIVIHQSFSHNFFSLTKPGPGL